MESSKIKNNFQSIKKAFLENKVTTIAIALIVTLVLVLVFSAFRFSNAVSEVAGSIISDNSSITIAIRNGEAVQSASLASSIDTNDEAEIVRVEEGAYFYRSITIPPGSETMYLSGSGAQPLADGSWGDMRQQTTDTFSRFKETLEEQGWSMGDIVQVRAFAVAGEDGLDFAGFNAGYAEFFGTSDNPNKPVRSFVEIKDLVVEGWLVEIEIRAARMP